MYKYLFIIISLFIVAGLFADTSGEYGFQMLKINSSVSVAAQAGTGAFSSEDAFTFINNPVAGLFYQGKVISFSRNFWIFDTSLNCLSYLSSNGKRSFGFFYRYLDYGSFERRDEVGTEILGEFHPLDISITANFGYRLNPNHKLGFNLHYLYEKIDTASSYGIALDLGYLFHLPIKDMMISTAVKNLGFTSKMDQEKIDLPISGEISLIKDFSFLNQKTAVEMKLIKNIDDDEFKAAFGINTTINNILTLRLGYKFNYDAENISTGFGVNIKRFSLDYTYLPLKYEINSVNMIGLSYKL